MKTTEIFPIDYTIGEHKPYELYLRPEYVCNYDKPLRSDILNRRIRMIKTNSEEAVSNEFADDGLIEITEAKRHLEQVILPQLVDVFDSLSIIPIDSASLTQVNYIYIYIYIGITFTRCEYKISRSYCRGF